MDFDYYQQLEIREMNGKLVVQMKSRDRVNT